MLNKLIRGETDSWKIHLSAAAGLITRLTAHICPQMSDVSPSEDSSQELPAQSRLSAFNAAKFLGLDSVMPSPEDIACEFLVGTSIWFDMYEPLSFLM